MGHDIFTMYSAKAAEYVIAVAYLLLFLPFWRFVNGRAPAVEPLPLRRWVGQMTDWFRVPAELYFHPGHAWARAGAGSLVTVGMDDFAQKLVGASSALALPRVGERVAQGEKAWSFASDGKSVDMLSPVDGTVVAVNPRVLSTPNLLERDPYGEGWLMKVRTPRLAANVKQLLSGSLAHRWMEESCDRLRTMMSPELGQLCQDGGFPVDGMARSLDPAGWDDVARRFLMT